MRQSQSGDFKQGLFMILKWIPCPDQSEESLKVPSKVELGSTAWRLFSKVIFKVQPPVCAGIQITQRESERAHLFNGLSA